MSHATLCVIFKFSECKCDISMEWYKKREIANTCNSVRYLWLSSICNRVDYKYCFLLRKRRMYRLFIHTNTQWKLIAHSCLLAINHGFCWNSDLFENFKIRKYSINNSILIIYVFTVKCWSTNAISANPFSTFLCANSLKRTGFCPYIFFSWCFQMNG